MRYHKKCVRCAVSFLGTKSMLVCGHCYGNEEDLQLAKLLEDHPMYTAGYVPPSLKQIEKMLKKIENNTCKY